MTPGGRSPRNNSSRCRKNLERSGLPLIQRPRILTSHGMAAQFFVGNDTNGVELECLPFVANEAIDLTLKNTAFSCAPSTAFTNRFRTQASVETHGGLVWRLADYGGTAGKNLAVFVSAELITNKTSFQQRLVPLTKPASTATATTAQELVGDGKLLFEMGKLDEAQTNLEAALAAEPQNATAKYYLALIQTNRQNQKLVYTGPGRQQIVHKLQSIRLDRVSFDGLPLGEVLRVLNEEARKRDDERKGVNFLVNSSGRQPQASPAIDPATGLPAQASPASAPDLISLPITLRPPLTNVSLGETLDALVKASPSPIHYSVQDFAIVFSAGEPVNSTNTANLFTRTFKLDPKVLAPGLNAVGVSPAGNAVERLKNFFAAFGVNWETPQGKTAFYNEAGSVFFVKATAEDLLAIERAVRVLNQAQFQNASLANSTNVSGVLSDTNFLNSLRALQQRGGADSLAEPEVTTSSGRGVNKIDSPLVYYSATRTNIVAKLDQIRLEKFSTGEAGKPLRDVLAQLNGEAKWRDPERKGINFIINPGGTNTVALEDVGAVIIKIPNLTNVRLADVLDAVVLVAEHPIKYSIRDSDVAFSAKGSEIPQLFMRTFRVDTNTFYRSLENASTQSFGSLPKSGSGMGIGDSPDWSPSNPIYIAPRKLPPRRRARWPGRFSPSWASIWSSRPASRCFSAMERACCSSKRRKPIWTRLSGPSGARRVPPQIHIKARFFEVPEGNDAAEWNLAWCSEICGDTKFSRTDHGHSQCHKRASCHARTGSPFRH